MFDITRNGIITISRGDNFTINTTINVGTLLEPLLYELQSGDKVYFALMEPNQPFEHALIRKVFTKEDQDEELNVSMNFKVEDTEYLMPGQYYSMVKLYRAEEDLVDTIITKTKFFIVD